MTTPPFSLPPIRNYFKERNFHQKIENKVYAQALANNESPETFYQDSDIKRIFRSPRNYDVEKASSRAANAEISQIIQKIKDTNHAEHEPFELFIPTEEPLPPNRIPAPGIIYTKIKYHRGRIVETTETVPETGFKVHDLLFKLIQAKYPQYLTILDTLCRPLGTTDATFTDFNKEQIPSQPIDEDRIQRILRHVKSKLAATPFLPLHYVDTTYSKSPLSTGTGYHNRHSYRKRAHAKFSHPEEYATKPTSKGYYYNAFHEYSRYIVHLIKETGYPFEFTFDDPPTEEQDLKFKTKLNEFMNSYPTLLFTRNHISEVHGNLKQRPVYAVDELFILIETMLLFPLLVQARSPDSCIMYGLETIRGSNVYLDKIAQKFSSFFTIDWSSFDQRLPRLITDIFFTHFLPSLIIIDGAYTPTYEYPTYPDLTEHSLYKKMDNLLHFLHLWFNNMTFVTQDGYGFRRTHAGIPSGHLATQYLGSFGNLFLLIDALIEFNCTDIEIEDLLLFIMGDDNSGFTHWSINKLEQFIDFLEPYAVTRYNMVLSKTKSVITTLRNRIETLSYTCNFGSPQRSISKLVAQLCYPERYLNLKFMSSRAIGIAYASCGSDPTFHELCNDVYEMYLPFQTDDLTSDELVKSLPSQFTYMEDILPLLDLSKFPTLTEVQKLIDHYHGPLSYAPKWNYYHFKKSPIYTPPTFKTMNDYRKEHNIPFVPTPLII
jgi:hypothetical protein